MNKIRLAIEPISHLLKKIILRAANYFGYDIRRINRSSVEARDFSSNRWSHPYQENPEVGPVNWAEKLARTEKGGPFEWPNILALNQAVAILVGASERIVELGGGTGFFAYEVTKDPKRFVLCSELDKDAIDWAQANRSRHNIRYVSRPVTANDGPFDLVVAVEVIEHIKDYRNFLETCITLAPRSIITTPNKSRNPRSAFASPPDYYHHVREWTAGEFYWVLKTYYQSVKLYAMPDVYAPQIVPILITDSMTPLIAVCEYPFYETERQFDIHMERGE